LDESQYVALLQYLGGNIRQANLENLKTRGLAERGAPVGHTTGTDPFSDWGK
jgi:hypothetical protein